MTLVDESNERSTVLGGGGYVWNAYIHREKYPLCVWKGKLNILDEESVFKTGEIE